MILPNRETGVLWEIGIVVDVDVFTFDLLWNTDMLRKGFLFDCNVNREEGDNDGDWTRDNDNFINFLFRLYSVSYSSRTKYDRGWPVIPTTVPLNQISFNFFWKNTESPIFNFEYSNSFRTKYFFAFLSLHVFHPLLLDNWEIAAGFQILR